MSEDEINAEFARLKTRREELEAELAAMKAKLLRLAMRRAIQDRPRRP